MPDVESPTAKKGDKESKYARLPSSTHVIDMRGKDPFPSLGWSLLALHPDLLKEQQGIWPAIQKGGVRGHTTSVPEDMSRDELARQAGINAVGEKPLPDDQWGTYEYWMRGGSLP